MNNAMYWAARICNELDVAHAAPGKRSWGEFGAEVVRKTGLSSVLLGSGLGLGGLSAIEGRKVEADIILTGTNPQPHLDRGAARTVEQGGNAMYTKFSYDFEGQNYSGVASGVGFNKNGRGWVLGNAHVDFIRSNLGGTLTFGTGSNVITNPGNQYSLVNAFTYSTYTGPSMWMTQPDFTIFQLDRELVGAGELVFAPSGPSVGDIVTVDSYGVMQFSNGTPIAPSGSAHSGFAKVSDINNFGGSFSNEFYFSTVFSGLSAGEQAGTDGASQGGRYDQFNRLLGLTTGGLLNNVGVDITLNTSSVRLQNFIADTTAVPEPTSFLFGLAAATVAYLKSRISKRSNKENQDGS